VRGNKGRASSSTYSLHSSSALVVNLFDYWSARDLSALLIALGLRPGAQSLEFEAQFATGLEGIPPNLDACIRYGDGRIVGVESKYTEWLTRKPLGKAPFKLKYFPDGKRLWAKAGLAHCQDLAERLQSGAMHFRHLDAAQLLKHALGLGCCSHGSFELYYLYYAVSDREAEVHRSEAMQFADLIGSDFPFHVRTYQEVYARLCECAGPQEGEYLEYLQSRYFGASELK
jgi:hypothetical protein